jgi:hypothetical protein
MHGRDYLQAAAWVLSLNHAQHPVQGNASRLAVWLAPAAAAAAGDRGSAGSSRTVDDITMQPVPAAACLTVQWLPLQKSSSGSMGSSANVHWRRPALQVGPAALLSAVQQPAGGAMLLRVQLRWRWLLWALSLRVQTSRPELLHAPQTGADAAGQPHNASKSSSSADSACWHPVVVYRSTWGVEHVSVINTTCSTCAPAAGRPSSDSTPAQLLAQVQQLLQTWLRAGRKVSSQPGNTANMRSSVRLAELAAGTEAQLLLDPRCSHAVSLRWDVVDLTAQLLLAHMSAAAGMAVALLLLVLSHQMSALVRMMTVARTGALPAATGSPARTPAALAAQDDHADAAGESTTGLDTAAAVVTNGRSSPDLRQLSAAALHRMRKRLDGTLGGAPPSMQKYYGTTAAAAAGAAAGPGTSAAGLAANGPAAGSTAGDGPDSQSGLRGVGVSVVESLVAVTRDARVLLLAALLAAAAAGLNSLNPSSLWYHHPSSSSSMAGPLQGFAAAAGWLLHQALALLGLAQRGDSPTLAGAVLLLGVALLFLLADVGLSVAVKWGLDWCSGAVAAFNRWALAASAAVSS